MKFINFLKENRPIIKNISWLSYERVLISLFKVAVDIWVARYLGVEAFGILTFALTLALVLKSWQYFGLNEVLMKEFVIDPNSSRLNFICATAISLVLGLIFLIALIGATYFLVDNKELRIVTIIIAFTFIFRPIDIMETWFNSQLKSKFVVIAKSFSVGIGFILKALSILNECPVSYFAIIYLVELIIFTFILCIFFKIHWPFNFTFSFEKERTKKLITTSFPFFISIVAITLNIKIDILMIKQIVGVVETGYYSAATMLSELWFFLPVLIVMSLTPMFAKLRMENIDIYNLRFEKLLSYFMLLSFVVIGFICIFADEIIILTFGSEYAKSADILIIHIFSSVFAIMGLVQNPWIVNENYGRFSIIKNVSGAIINIVLNLILIPEYGGIGAAIATLVSYSISNFFINIFYTDRTRKYFASQLRSLLIYPILIK